MAKYVATISGDLNEFSNYLTKQILDGSISASLEEQEYMELNGVCCCVQAYERYSAMGGNRVSLHVTMLSNGEQLRLTAITSGGSQAVFFKINTIGEEAFLDKLREAVEQFKRQ